MRSVEVSARKREDAINKALQELGIERHEAHVEILDEGSPGFLGIGVRDVTVRVSTEVPGEGGFPIEADGNRVDAEPRENRRGRKKGPRNGGDKHRPKRDRKNGDRGPRAQQRGRGGKGGKRDRTKPGGQQKSRAGKSGRNEASRKSDRPKRRRSERPRDERPRPEPKERPPAKVLTDPRSSQAAALLQEVIAHMGIESTVQPVEAEQGGLKLAVESPDSALLIGRKGRNLTAMQYVINRILNRQDEWQQNERIVVDVEGYLDRRRDTLEDMATRFAERAKATGRRVRVKPLS
ncbi:MAG: Jag N-terminal domain-containing protein, partial [Candidatus Hydrogenedentota bacterium]